MGMMHLSSPKFINKILTFPPPIISWVQVLLCHLGHLYVPESEHAKLIWEAHYSQMEGHFGMEKTVVILQKTNYWPKLRHDVSKYIGYFTSCAISKPTIKKQ
jgi:hypothetical protein